MRKVQSAVIGAAIAVALAAMPVSPASAHGRHGGGLFFGLAAVTAAVVVGAATLVTAPIAIATAPFRGPVYYPPPAPAYPAPGNPGAAPRPTTLPGAPVGQGSGDLPPLPPQTNPLTPAQLSMLLEGIDWRAPRRTWSPEAAG